MPLPDSGRSVGSPERRAGFRTGTLSARCRGAEAFFERTGILFRRPDCRFIVLRCGLLSPVKVSGEADLQPLPGTAGVDVPG